MPGDTKHHTKSSGNSYTLTKPLHFVVESALRVGDSDDRRDRQILRLGWIVVVITLIAVTSHWLFGFPSNHAMPIFYWAFVIVCGIGLFNALGFLDRNKR
jgi:hypothetical protein